MTGVKWSDGSSAKEAGGEQSVGMDDKRQKAVRDTSLTESIGYQVDAPEGHLGIVQKVPRAGRPQRPLALVVSDRKTVRLVPLSRIADVVPLERRIVLGPEGASGSHDPRRAGLAGRRDPTAALERSAA
jgi:hypothetical protein